MKKSIRIAAFVAAVSGLMAISSLAQANGFEEETGWYIIGAVGAAGDGDVDFKVAGETALPREGTANLESGGASMNLGFGRRLYKNIRFEAEYIYIPYEITDAEYTAVESDTVTLEQLNATNKLSGEVKVQGLMVNAIYDFDTGTKWVPFVGVGVGMNEIDYKGKAELLGQAGESGGKETSMAAQLQFGLGYEFENNWTLSGVYKIHYAGGTDMKQENGSVIKHSDSVNPHFYITFGHRF